MQLFFFCKTKYDNTYIYTLFDLLYAWGSFFCQLSFIKIPLGQLYKHTNLRLLHSAHYEIQAQKIRVTACLTRCAYVASLLQK